MGGISGLSPDHVDEFRAIAEPLYRRDPVANTIELTLFEAAHFADGSLFC